MVDGARRELKRLAHREKLGHLEVALSHVQSFRQAVDVGAHVGGWTMVMARMFERVLAFEPLESSQARWRRNMAGIGNATLIGAALGDERAMVRLQGGELHSKHYCVKDAGGGVEMLRLDDFGLTDLDFLKVDTEGADALVLAGAEQTIRRCRPVVIVESVPRFEARYGLPEGAPMAFLEQLGARRVAAMWRDYVYVFPREARA